MKRIRSHIESALSEAGFTFEGKDTATDSRAAWLEYSRPGLILRCVFEPRDARLVAETLDDKAEHSVVANVELHGALSGFELLERVEDFGSAVGMFLRTLHAAE